MSVNPVDFLNSAKELSERQNEMALRNAVSRAYYGVYHYASDTARAIALPDYQDGTTHDRLAARFRLNGHKSIAYRIADQHRNRCHADYKIDQTLTAQKAHADLANMEKLIADLTTLSEEHGATL